MATLRLLRRNQGRRQPGLRRCNEGKTRAAVLADLMEERRKREVGQSEVVFSEERTQNLRECKRTKNEEIKKTN